jgi:HK97 family phage portal protein
MTCVGVKARAISQLPIRIMAKGKNGELVDALLDESVGPRDKNKARAVLNLLQQPNNFQSQYEFWYQWMMWHEMLGEAFTLWFRADQKNPTQTPLEMYILDSTLIAVTINEMRYPSYRLSTPSYGFNKDEPLNYWQVMHCKDMAWQGSAGFNKGMLAAELVGLDQDIDIYANYVMLNGAKPSGVFRTEQVIPNSKFEEIAARLKEAWSSMVGSQQTDKSKPGQSILLDQGMTYEAVQMLTLQDTDLANLKEQTMKRICSLYGVPAAMAGITDSKYNNTQTMLDEFYKTTMYPILVNVQQKLKAQLFNGYPNLCVQFETNDFLKGAALDQMNFATAGVNAGIMTPNEAREYLGMCSIENGDKLKENTGKTEPIAGSSPTDTGGGGGSQTRKMNIGK